MLRVSEVFLSGHRAWLLSQGSIMPVSLSLVLINTFQLSHFVLVAKITWLFSSYKLLVAKNFVKPMLLLLHRPLMSSHSSSDADRQLLSDVVSTGAACEKKYISKAHGLVSHAFDNLTRLSSPMYHLSIMVLVPFLLLVHLSYIWLILITICLPVTDTSHTHSSFHHNRRFLDEVSPFLIYSWF